MHVSWPGCNVHKPFYTARWQKTGKLRSIPADNIALATTGPYPPLRYCNIQFALVCCSKQWTILFLTIHPYNDNNCKHTHSSSPPPPRNQWRPGYFVAGGAHTRTAPPPPPPPPPLSRTQTRGQIQDFRKGGVVNE